MTSKLSLQTINSLTILELEALKFFENNKQLVSESSIHFISKRVFLSTATIMRLCKKLGFSGFSELKYVLKQELQTADLGSQNLNYSSLLKHHLAGINNTASQLSEKDTTKAVELLMNAKNIHIFSKGITYCVGSYISKMLLTLGIANFCYESTTIAYIAMEKLCETDLVILLSHSGNTHQIARAGKIARMRNAKIISITSHSVNELAEISDCSIGTYTDNLVARSGLIDIESRIPMLFVANFIINIFIEKSRGEKGTV